MRLSFKSECIRPALLSVAGGFLLLLVALPSLKSYRDDLKFEKFLSGIGDIPVQAVILNPLLSGYNEQNQPFKVKADAARPVNIEKRIIYFDNVQAQLEEKKGTMKVFSKEAKFSEMDHALVFRDKVYVDRSDGSKAEFSEMSIDTKTRKIISSKPVQANHPAGRIEAGSVEGSFPDKVIKFKGRVRMVLDPEKNIR